MEFTIPEDLPEFPVITHRYLVACFVVPSNSPWHTCLADPREKSLSLHLQNLRVES